MKSVRPDVPTQIEFCSGFGNAIKAVTSDPKVALLGAAQSAFEGAMYTFVFMWTPAIATPDTKASLPYGTIFAAFMVRGRAISALCG